MIAGDAGNLVAKMRRGVLPYCVLAMVRDKERYGFELVQSLASIDGMVTGEGTLVVRIVDATGGPTTARVHLEDSHGNRPRARGAVVISILTYQAPSLPCTQRPSR